MKLIFILMLNLAVAVPANAQSMTVADALAIKERAGMGSFGARAEWNALTFYLQGAVESAVAYQEALVQKGAEPLFCPPRNTGHSIESLFAILERSPAAERRKTAVAVILDGFTASYPCRK